jgi:hypothetical protein
MTGIVDQKNDGPVGSGVVLSKPSPNMSFKTYLADRPGPLGRSWGAEMAFDVTMTLPYPVGRVWEVFKDFNRWMGRFGYEWDGILGNKEDNFVSLGNKPGANDLKWQDGLRIKYIVRKVVPERLIYLDSPPAPIEDPSKNGFWEGHNLMMLHEEGKRTKIVVFIEHTFYSETMSLEELRAEAGGWAESGVAFWRDYFIPDLFAAVEAHSRAAQ